jgi:hypothetical protein
MATRSVAALAEGGDVCCGHEEEDNGPGLSGPVKLLG